MLRHAFVSPQPDGPDATKIRASNWNGDHVVDDASALSAAIGIHVVTGNPNGTLSAPNGDLARDTNGQLWINTSGVGTSGSVWTAMVRADGGTAPQQTLFELWTDSNGMGAQTDASQDDPDDHTATPNTNVRLVKMYTTNFAEPVTPFDMGSGSLRLETSTTPAHGPELIIGKFLNEIINGPGSTPDAAHMIWIDQLSIHSSMVAQWTQGSSAGTLSPLLGGGNLDTDSNNRALTAAAVSGRSPACAFVMLGTNDASDNTATANLATNIASFMARKRAVHGSQLLFVWVVMQSTLPVGTFVNVAVARASQIAALAAATGTAAVYAEGIPTVDDFAHFTSVGVQILGLRMAKAYVRLKGLRERAVTSPTVVGVSQATFNGTVHGSSGITGASGANLRAFPWQASSDGDLMFLPVFTGAIGAGTSIPTPSGWTQQGTQISSLDGPGVGNRVALFTKICLQTDLDGNSPSTGGPGFPTDLSIAPGGAQFMCKPFTVRGATVLNAGPVAFTHTTSDTTPVTAPGVTTTASGRTVCILVTCWSSSGQSFTVTNGNLTGLTQVFGAAYPSSSGNFLYMGLWTGTLTVAGASGNSTVTPAIACTSQGYTWAM